MPTLLGRNPFHHPKGQHPPPSLGSQADNVRSSRSFLGFMNHTSSRDSTGSETFREPSDIPKRSGGSMNELKRFFRPAILHRKHSQSSLRNGSPEHHSHTQSAIPPSSDSSLSLSNRVNIYHDDAILAQKYGKLGKVLGSGAGGSVRVIVRPSDGATFAVKEFRPRRPTELVKDYAKKCTAEFCIGSTLHHPNVIETLDIFSDAKQNKYYEVMEYCPIDFFAVVMSGNMSRGEINCCLRQLTEGVRYLHSMGLAHRDLKLDNCVMTCDGILKLIDFGSAVVFKYPFDANVSMAHGIVGSDPYLAPEVMTSTKRYDPQFVDIWSIGIIYCCMMLKRFPWKTPKESDDNFRLFCLPDDVEHDYVKSAQEHETLMRQRRQEKHRARKLKEERVLAEESEPSPVPNHGRESNAISTQPAKDANADSKNDSQGVAAPVQKDTPPESVTEKKKTKNETVADTNEKLQDVQQPACDSQAAQNKDASNSQGPQEKAAPDHKSGPRHHGKGRKVMHGPYRLLRLLPHASRPIMSRILTVDPKERATLEDIYSDEWFANIPFCTRDAKKGTIRAPGHTHTIVCEEDAHLESYKV
ncbi:LAQU0S01e04786g1_1 [Lachancea quebecensis]|uniref:non-specific serine/threonine protein kinase n=1 Tax=Lachancea quebecensis TaxID=1654605 RepID=A0A0P1KLQ7_9SACH|nr:LAQU0S01e04786g1_1 [Lachancea quebecensis]